MSSDAPRFSIVVPCHDAAQTLPETVASVLAQTDADFELILVDDGSTDETYATAQALAETDPRIRFVAQSNGGVASARNCGLSLARGALVAFLDADDLWEPTKLARHRAVFDGASAIGVTYARIRFLCPDGTPTAVTSAPMRGPLTVERMLAENVACTMSNVVVRRSVLDRVGWFEEGLAFDEDKAFLFAAFAGGMGFHGIDAVLTGYRTSPQGLASDIAGMERDWLRFVDLARDIAPEAVDAAFPVARALFLRNLARRALRLGQRGAAGLLLRAVRAAPRAVRVEPRRWLLTGAGALLSALAPRAALAAALDALPSRPCMGDNR